MVASCWYLQFVRDDGQYDTLVTLFALSLLLKISWMHRTSIGTRDRHRAAELCFVLPKCFDIDVTLAPCRQVEETRLLIYAGCVEV